MIPEQLLADKANVGNLLEYLTSELERVRSERRELEEDWVRYAKVYQAEPESKEKTFPWKGAANFVMPVAGTDVDTTVAGLMGALWASKNLWSTEAIRPDMVDLGARLQEMLTWGQDAELKMYPVTRDWITEITKLGTGILKQRYVRDQRVMYEWREQGGGVLAQHVRRMAANRPEVKRVALPDFYIPATSGTIVEAPWCAERLQLRWHQLESRVNAGIYSPQLLSAIGYHWRQTQARSQYGMYQSAIEELNHFVPSYGDTFELFEFWTRYDIGRIGEPVSVVCTIHLPTKTYARIDYNPFFNQEAPYSSARFIAKEGQFYGIGLCQILEDIQEVVSALECQRLDNGTIRNTAIFKGRRGSGVKADEPIWPGRTILMDNPETDMVPMFMGQASGSTLNEEQFILEYGKQRSGVSGWQMGGAGQPNISYSAATTTVEMLRQGRLRLDQTMREIQDAMSETGQRVVELYQQFDQGGKAYMVMGDREGAMVQRVLQFPLDIIRSCVLIRTTATSAHLNKETQIRTNQILFGLTGQTYQQAMQAMQIAINPQVPIPLRMLSFQMLRGLLTLARRTMDAHDVQDLDQILPDAEFVNAIGAQLGIQQGPQFGGAGMGPGLGQPPGLPALPPGGPGAYGPAAQPAPGGFGPQGNVPLSGPIYGPA